MALFICLDFYLGKKLGLLSEPWRSVAPVITPRVGMAHDDAFNPAVLRLP
jgi:hypothetical protein